MAVNVSKNTRSEVVNWIALKFKNDSIFQGFSIMYNGDIRYTNPNKSFWQALNIKMIPDPIAKVFLLSNEYKDEPLEIVLNLYYKEHFHLMVRLAEMLDHRFNAKTVQISEHY